MLLAAVLGGGIAIPVYAQDGAPPAAPPPIATIPSDGFNMKVVEQPTPYYVITTLEPPVFNWFAGTFTNLPTDKEVTIGLSMNEMDHLINNADVSKWAGLKPVMTYGDPTNYATYEWFEKDNQGRWVSSDPFKVGDARYAGTGKIPEQTVMPKEVAPVFLSADGKRWSAWREIDDAEAVGNLNIFRCKQRFLLPSATVAMRIPFTYTYLQQFITRLRAAELPEVFVDEIGTTQGQRQLQVIRLEGRQQTTIDTLRTVLVIAREHATEAASSWALYGGLTALLADTPEAVALRKNTTWLFIPIQDPDGSVNATFDNLTSKMCHANDPNTPKEVFDYAQYFIDKVNGKQSIDVSMVLHNVEANESPNLMCPFVDVRFPEQVVAFNTQLFDAARAKGYQTTAPETNYGRGWMNFRLYGWCALHFGTFDLAFEVNECYPGNRLSITQLTQLGGLLVQETGRWLAGTEGEQWHQHARQVLEERAKKRAEFFKTRGIGPPQRSKTIILMRAY